MNGSDDILNALVTMMSSALENAQIEGECRSHLDNEKRPSPLMVIVSCDNVEQINVGLPDYRMHFSILVDSFIADDRDGVEFKKTVEVVTKKLEDISERGTSFSELENPYVVGCFYQRADISLTQESNRCVAGLDVVVSYP